MVKSKVVTLNASHLRLFFALLIITFLSLFLSVSQANDKPYPGKLVDIGTHRLYIHCEGQGTPSVIVDSGIGGLSLEWIKIQHELADNVRICSYDRAGYGWSDPGPLPRTTAQISFELHRLLTEANIPGPYLLVGHSFGGYNIRYFASEYPELTAGLVFIDSSHPGQFNTYEFRRVKPEPVDTNSVKYKNSIKIRMVHPIIADNFPAVNKRIAFMLMSTMKAKRTLMNELDNMEYSAKQLAQQEKHAPYDFPVVIITRGMRVWPDDELGNRREQQWTWLQNDLEKISLQSYHYIARHSGHIVHLDEPELVSSNILFAVNKVKAQMREKELIEKFDIRLAHYGTIPAFSESDSTLMYSDIPDNNISLMNKFIQPVMFNSNSRNFGNHSSYFLR